MEPSLTNQNIAKSCSREMTTPMSTSCYLDKDEGGKPIEVTKYRGMIVSLLCLTASRPNIMFSVCMCARYQVNPKESHLSAGKKNHEISCWNYKYGLVVPQGNLV